MDSQYENQTGQTSVSYAYYAGVDAMGNPLYYVGVDKEGKNVYFTYEQVMSVGMPIFQGQAEVPKTTMPAENMSQATAGKKKVKPLSPEDKKKANRLCIISLVLFSIPSVCALFMSILEKLGLDIIDYDPYDYYSSSELFNQVSSFFGVMFIAMLIGALVLMIIARIKYPASTFAKVLMIIYIVSFALFIIGWLLIIAFFYIMCAGLGFGWQGCW